ncbi:MAG: VanZ family protein [Deltaproteobacteria bacterium]|nr:VanZ family protein [Deltaproteobacteria bacterium]
MKELRFIRLWLTIGFMLVGVVCFLTLTPSPPDIGDFPESDKIGHFVAYSVMMLWFGFIYLRGRRYMRVGLAFIVMGIALELIQGMLDYRSFSTLDMGANVCGVMIGWLLARTRLADALVYVEGRLRESSMR